MLIIFQFLPVSAPFKSMPGKQFVCQVIFVDFVVEICISVCVSTCSYWFDNRFAVYFFDVRIVKRIYIDSKSKSVF